MSEGICNIASGKISAWRMLARTFTELKERQMELRELSQDGLHARKGRKGAHINGWQHNYPALAKTTRRHAASNPGAACQAAAQTGDPPSFAGLHHRTSSMAPRLKHICIGA